MKNGKRLSVAQRKYKYLESLNLNSDNWLISKCTTEKWKLVHRYTGQPKDIPAP